MNSVMTMDGFASPANARSATAAAMRDHLPGAAVAPPDAASKVAGILRLPARLRRDLLLLISIKLMMLWLLYVLFFSSAHRPAIDVIAHIAGHTPP